MSAKAPPEDDAEQAKVKQAIRDLTLMLLYLTRWTEDRPKKLPPGARMTWKAWKGHDWETLDQLMEQGTFDFSYRAKSVSLIDKGEREATRLIETCGHRPPAGSMKGARDR